MSPPKGIRNTIPTGVTSCLCNVLWIIVCPFVLFFLSLYCLFVFNLRLLIYTFGILWPLYCLSVFNLRLLIYTFGIVWPLYCLSVFNLRLLIYTFGIYKLFSFHSLPTITYHHVCHQYIDYTCTL
jgi:hypothetical protein